MNAWDRGRKVACTLVAAASAVGIAPQAASAQQGVGSFFKSKAAAPAPAPKENAPAADVPSLKEVRVPTNTNDPIAVVNGEVITRQQLADECVARKGQEILETLIARRLIEQEIKKRGLTIGAAEIDAEIDSVAETIGHVSRENWLRTLDKERGISPATYARDIIYPALALRKLAEPRVQVTEQDLKDALEANYGPRIRCRLIMTDKIHSANEIWEELRRNPGGFEKIAKARSMDTSTRANGGLLPEPIARHAYPRNVSDAAYAQLVDGDPQDKNPAHKPKDGDITGPIQVTENSWIIMRREEYIAGRQGTLADPNIKNTLHAQMFDVKLKDAMNSLYEDMMRAASIDNKLTGTMKEGHEDQKPEYRAGLDSKVNRMSTAGETAPTTLPNQTRAVAPEATSPVGAARPPAGVPSSAVNAANTLKQAIQSAPPGTGTSVPKN